jgi:LPXTG-site transpeptidase (sortase) family protein
MGAFSQAPVIQLQPTHLLIPSLEIDAPIEAVGQDDNGMMAAPSRIERVAWYSPGSVPRETGNAVMAGHLDDVRGKPAVFWRLDEVEPGDEIIVHYSDKSEKHFEVITVESYDADAAPLERIFGVDFERDLNLITCDGQWNAQSKLYERRLVVYSRLIRHSTTNIVPESSTVATTALANTAALPISQSPRTAQTRQDHGQPFATH